MVFFNGEPSPREREKAVWVDIDFAFSRPTSPTDDIADYVPTQIITEHLRIAGYDGIAYRSAYGKGHNVVLFDLDIATQVNCFVVRVRDMKYVLEDEPYSYAVKKSKSD